MLGIRPGVVAESSESSSPPQPLGYQPALDGIRAVAVLSVMLFHAGIDNLRGGFLGVDLFFVLSGFLITTLLLREHGGTGRVSLRDFYVRRVRRLFPALLAVLAAVVLYQHFVAPVATRRSVRLDAIASLFYVANWRFVFSHQSYFGALLEPSPLRHVWSLAVEEQWYLFWPIVLVGLLRLLRRRPVVLTALIAGAGLLSLGWMWHLTRGSADVSRAYYGTDSHAFVLLAGAALAVARHAWPAREGRGARVADLAGVAALVAVGWFFFVADGQDRWLYGWGYGVFAVLGLVIVEAAMAPGRGIVKRVLGVGVLAWVGRLSYGLYLWHWPIDVWLNPSRFEWSKPVLTTVRMVVAVAVSVVSYYALERPIRTAAWQRLPAPRLATAGAAALGTLVVAAMVVVGIHPPAHEAATPWGGGGPPPPSGKVAYTPIPVVPGNLRVMVVGDSVGFTEVFGAEPTGATMIGEGRIGCGLVPYTGDPQGVLLRWDGQPGACQGVTDDWRFGISQKPDVVVLVAGAWEVYDRRIDGVTYRVGSDSYAELITQHLDDLRAFIRARTSVPLVIQDVPCMRPTEFGVGGGPNPRGDDSRVAWLNQVFRRYAAAHPADVKIVKVSDYDCPGGRFRKTVDGMVLRPDGVHYKPEATTGLWNFLVPRIRTAIGLPASGPVLTTTPGRTR